jgi:beta-lactamase superfamily II metal-dependent hydrolase
LIGNNHFVPPDNKEFELSLFGTGYGESIVLHLGFDYWIIIDSCRDPASKKPAALEYLLNLGVDVSSQVSMVAATHWDTDHIEGLAQIIQAAKSARFVCSSATNSDEFDRFVAFGQGTVQLLPKTSSAEIVEILTEIPASDRTQRKPRLASAGKVLLDIDPGVPIIVQALSPSDADVIAALARLKNIPSSAQKMNRIRLPRMDSNDASVALSVRIGEEAFCLLGADLEEIGSTDRGWQAIVTEWPSHKGRHRVFKIPHHGSKNGHHDLIWSTLLESKPYSVLTSCVHGRTCIPTREDCERILNASGHAFLTTIPRKAKYKDPNPAVRRTMSDMTDSVHVVNPSLGHVRLRRSLASGSEWKLNLFGAAAEMTSGLISQLV